jgi:hypothetical protein
MEYGVPSRVTLYILLLEYPLRNSPAPATFTSALALQKFTEARLKLWTGEPRDDFNDSPKYPASIACFNSRLTVTSAQGQPHSLSCGLVAFKKAWGETNNHGTCTSLHRNRWFRGATLHNW